MHIVQIVHIVELTDNLLTRNVGWNDDIKLITQNATKYKPMKLV